MGFFCSIQIIGRLPAQKCTGSGLDSVAFGNTKGNGLVALCGINNAVTVHVEFKAEFGSGLGGNIVIFSCIQGQVHILIGACKLQGLVGCSAAANDSYIAVILAGQIPQSRIVIVFKDYDLLKDCAYIIAVLGSCESVGCTANILAVYSKAYKLIALFRSCRQGDLFTHEVQIAVLGNTLVVHIVVDGIAGHCAALCGAVVHNYRLHIGLDAEGNLHTVFSQVIIVTQVDEHLGIGSDAAFRITGSIGTLGQITVCHLLILNEQIDTGAVTDNTKVKAILIVGSDLIGVN